MRSKEGRTMNDADERRVLELCARWDFPRGPLVEIDDEKEMTAEVERLGEGAARGLAELLARVARADFDHLNVLEVFCGRYLDRFREAMSEALSATLAPDGPAPTLGLLGDVSLPGLSKKIASTVALAGAAPELVRATIDALRDIGDADA